MKLPNIPSDLPLDRVWIPVSDAASANDCLQLLQRAQRAAPRPSDRSNKDHV